MDQPPLADLPHIDPEMFYKIMFKYMRFGLAESAQEDANAKMIALMGTTLTQLGYTEGVELYKNFVTRTRQQFVKEALSGSP